MNTIFNEGQNHQPGKMAPQENRGATPPDTNIHEQNLKIALDVGTTKVVAVAGYRNQNGKIQVVDYSVLQNTGMVQGEIFNLLETADTIRHVKEELEMKLGRPIRKVTVGISGDHIRTLYTREYFIRTDPSELISDEDLNQLAQMARKSVIINPNEEILDVYPQAFLVDNQVVHGSPVGALGKRLEASFMVVVGNVEKIKKLERSIDMAGLEIEDIFLQPIASARAVMKEPQCQLGMALVDIGGGTSDILICNKGKVRFAGIIPYGGDYITTEIIQKFHLTPSMAEMIKMRYGSVKPDAAEKNITLQIPLDWSPKPLRIKREMLSETIRFKVDIIINEIDRFLNEYREFFPGEQIGLGLIVTGGGSQMKNLIQYLQFKLGMDVTSGDPRALLAPDAKIERLYQPQFATVIGLLDLALQKEKESQKEPSEWRNDKRQEPGSSGISQNNRPQTNTLDGKKHEDKDVDKLLQNPDAFSPKKQNLVKRLLQNFSTIFGKVIDETNN